MFDEEDDDWSRDEERPAPGFVLWLALIAGGLGLLLGGATEFSPW